jgi:hypothetical protein
MFVSCFIISKSWGWEQSQDVGLDSNLGGPRPLSRNAHILGIYLKWKALTEIFYCIQTPEGTLSNGIFPLPMGQAFHFSKCLASFSP